MFLSSYIVNTNPTNEISVIISIFFYYFPFLILTIYFLSKKLKLYNITNFFNILFSIILLSLHIYIFPYLLDHYFFGKINYILISIINIFLIWKILSEKLKLKKYILILILILIIIFYFLLLIGLQFILKYIY